MKRIIDLNYNVVFINNKKFLNKFWILKLIHKWKT